MTGNRNLTLVATLLVAIAFVVGACGVDGDDAEPLDQASAELRVAELADEIGWLDAPVTRRASVAPPEKQLADTLPDIDQFELVVDPQPSADQVVAEIFASTEKSGSGTDGWMVEAAESFNASNAKLADGRDAKVAIRKIASGTGYQFIAAGEEIPAGFSPSNQLWIEMASTHSPMSLVAEQTVPNVAGIVMKDETAAQMREDYGELNTQTLIEAVIAGELVMGYTDPFASSTGLNFLLTVLDDFADGDEARLVAPDVASVFEEFQEQVPFVAFTTIQMRDSVEKDNGTLDAFVMEYQTFAQTESLRSGFEFIPFGVRHDNPLYAFDAADPGEQEALQLFASHIEEPGLRDKAAEYGFEPPAYTSDVAVPSGSTLIEAQELWKEKKDAGRPVYAVFVTDTSGSMAGSRIFAVQQALSSAREFINPEASIGMVEFSDVVSKRLELAPFDLNQQARFEAAVQDMDPVGGTAMYDGIILGLSMLQEQRQIDPSGKYMLVVLTDGETNEGLGFGAVDEVIAGARIPVITVGFEADLEELGRVASLVEAASINASEGDVEFKLVSLFNAGV
jgi:Ca-activated chloride channel family protein